MKLSKITLLGFVLCSAAGAQVIPPPPLQTLSFTFAPLKCTSWNSGVVGGPPGVFDCGLGSLSGDFTFRDYFPETHHIFLSDLEQLRLFGSVFSLVSAFDYSPSTGLSFSATDEWRSSVTTGVSYQYVSPAGGNRLTWMPETTTTIPAVPELASSWTLLAGVVLLGWRLRARPRRVARH